MELDKRNLFVILFFIYLSFEIGIRFFDTNLSRNIKQIKEIPDVSKEIFKSSQAEKDTILFLGNSLTGRAVNLEQFETVLKNNRINHYAAYKVVPDSTSIWDWYCIVKNNFFIEGYAPDFLVIGVAWEREKPIPSRLGTHFCGISDLDDLIGLGMNNSSEILEYLVASASKLYSLREPIRNRFLDLIIPYYQVETQKINEVGNLNSKIKSKKAVEGKSARLHIYSEFIEMLKVQNITPVFVAMPLLEEYILDERLTNLIIEKGGYYLDYRKLDGLQKSMFVDPIHLSEQGSLIFTRMIGRDLQGIVDND